MPSVVRATFAPERSMFEEENNYTRTGSPARTLPSIGIVPTDSIDRLYLLTVEAGNRKMNDDQNPFGELGKCIALVPQLLARMERVEKLLESFEKPQHARKFLTLTQAAEELNLCVKSVRRLIARGLLKTSKGTRAVRVPVEEIEAYKRRTV